MPPRRGVDHHYAGAHLSVGVRVLNETELLADPADGATVARCHSCGSPDRRDAPLATFLLGPLGPVPLWVERLLERQGRLFYRVCEHCALHAQNRIDPMAADPLTVMA